MGWKPQCDHVREESEMIWFLIRGSFNVKIVACPRMKLSSFCGHPVPKETSIIIVMQIKEWGIGIWQRGMEWIPHSTIEYPRPQTPECWMRIIGIRVNQH